MVQGSEAAVKQHALRYKSIHVPQKRPHAVPVEHALEILAELWTGLEIWRLSDEGNLKPLSIHASKEGSRGTSYCRLP